MKIKRSDQVIQRSEVGFSWVRLDEAAVPVVETVV